MINAGLEHSKGEKKKGKKKDVSDERKRKDP